MNDNQRVCPLCGSSVPLGAEECPNCGGVLLIEKPAPVEPKPTVSTVVEKEPLPHCPHCGAEHPVSARFCPACGLSLMLRGDVDVQPGEASSVEIFKEASVQPSEAISVPPKKIGWILGAGTIMILVCGLIALAGVVWVFPQLQIPVTKFIVSPTHYTQPTERLMATSALGTSQYLQITSPTIWPSPISTFSLFPTATFTPFPTATFTPLPTATQIVSTPRGKIVFTCQMLVKGGNQICIMNADGTGYRRLTTVDYAENYYASLAPDGNSVVFSSNRTGKFEIYEMDLSGNAIQLTDGLGESAGPEISPDGRYIAFANNHGGTTGIWIMNRDGSNPHEIYYAPGADSVDPTWSPDSTQILFANGALDNFRQLYIINMDGKNLQLVNNEFRTRGRSDWSPDGQMIASYSGNCPSSGKCWNREVFLLNIDGSNPHQISSGGNCQAPNFSPDGQWITFTGYIDNYGDDNGCEIYIMRVNGTEVKRLTNNNYCDWQPRWGP